MLFQEGILKKRDGQALSRENIETMVAMVADGRAANEQLGAWTMAILLRGMDARERGDLTRAMAHSGRVLHWPGLQGRVVDKHSSGGVGDKVSLMLAPIAAACGVHVPMISGRGLGHTGGTLDKLDSIPGYNTRTSIETFQRVVREVGTAIIGQTDDLAPADRRLYAIRDVSGTVESPALITASILSKKLAAGLDRLAMDVKVGNGAFCKTLQEARTLAQSLAETGAACGLPIRTSITSMQQVLGASAGNALEVREAVAFLTGQGAGGAPRDTRLEHLTLHLAADMLLPATDTDPAHYQAAYAKAQQALASGAAAAVFARMVTALGGPSDLLEHPAKHLLAAPCQLEVTSPQAGWVQAVDAYRLGLVVIRLGGGRQRASDSIDPRVGLDGCLGIGAQVEAGAPLTVIHAASVEAAQAVQDEVRQSFQLSPTKVVSDTVLIETTTSTKV